MGEDRLEQGKRRMDTELGWRSRVDGPNEEFCRCGPNEKWRTYSFTIGKVKVWWWTGEGWAANRSLRTEICKTRSGEDSPRTITDEDLQFVTCDDGRNGEGTMTGFV